MKSTYPVKVTQAGIPYLEMAEELAILEDLMIIDLNLTNIQEYTDKIDEVLHSGSPQEISGSTTLLKIDKNRTIVYNFAIDQECTLETKELKEILKNYLKQSILMTIEQDLRKKQAIYEKVKNLDDITDFLKIRSELQQDKIV
ncbi:hypothetical protein [Bacillus sp. P14.5]|uniref:hypothetical protein n=1 Tax=Bacillus sp. P14.5 TaxID=1983400 RepID=UPI000DEA7FF1|nr:hypothetical protein [Bacillus sp. P14.5]